MKIKNIAAICKKNKSVVLFERRNDEGDVTLQYIGDGGAEFAVKCDKFTVTRDGFGNVAGYKISGITENKPVYIDFTQVAAVVRVYSDEREVADDEQCASIL